MDLKKLEKLKLEYENLSNKRVNIRKQESEIEKLIYDNQREMKSIKIDIVNKLYKETYPLYKVLSNNLMTYNLCWIEKDNLCTIQKVQKIEKVNKNFCVIYFEKFIELLENNIK